MIRRVGRIFVFRKGAVSIASKDLAKVYEVYSQYKEPGAGVPRYDAAIHREGDTIIAEDYRGAVIGHAKVTDTASVVSLVQNVLNNNTIVYIKGRIDIGANKVTIPDNRLVFTDYGLYDAATDTLHGGGIIGNLGTDVIVEVGKNSEVVGLAIVNLGGPCARITGENALIHKCHLYSAGDAITDTVASHTKVLENLVEVGGGANGVHFNPATAKDLVNVKVLDNIFRGYDATTPAGTAIAHTNITGVDMNSLIDRNHVENFSSEGLKSVNEITLTASGDGTTTTFDVAHGLPFEPKYLVTLPQSADAQGIHTAYLVDTDADGFRETIRVEFAAAPAAGTNNVVVRIIARI